MAQNFDKINVLFVMVQMEMGGSERLVHNLALKMDRGLFNPSVAWFLGDRILKDFNDLNIPLYHVLKIGRIDLSAMRKLGDIIKDNDIHIVNAHHFMSMVYSFYGSKMRNHAALVYVEHSKWEIDQIPLKWRIMGNCLLKRADGVIGVSSAVTAQIKNIFKINNSKALTIGNGVDLEAFKSENEKQRSLRKELDLRDNEKVIGIVANFKRIKNHVFLLRAFNELIRDYNNVKLLLIGQGFESDPENSEKEIRKFINEKGLATNIRILGFRSDIPQLLGIMDIFCLTSFKEGLPISVIEALAAGLPIVGTDVEGIRDLIIPNKNGILIKIGDVVGLKNALHSLIKNESLRNKFGEESKSLAKDVYSLERCVKQYQDLFLSLVKK